MRSPRSLCPQFSHSVSIGEVFQPFNHFCDSFQQVHVIPALGTPQVQVGSHLSKSVKFTFLPLMVARRYLRKFGEKE